MRYFFAIAMITNFCFSQGWKKKQLLDEFGDKTNAYRYQLKSVGSFDNSAQSGSKAILYLIFNSSYSEYIKSINSLSFEVYEYSDNPAEFYRSYETLYVALKNKNGDVFRSEVIPNEFDQDNSFSLNQYLFPKEKIKERTTRKRVNEYTYEVTKPTYDIDFKVIEEIIFKKQNVKLNIYTENCSYYFEFESLGIPYSDEDLALIEKANKEKERKNNELRELENKAAIKNSKIENILVKGDSRELDEYSTRQIKEFLNKIRDEDFNKINEVVIILSPDLRLDVAEFSLKNSGIVGVKFKNETGQDVDLSQYGDVSSPQFLEYKLLQRLKLKKESTYSEKYFLKLIEKEALLKNQVGQLLQSPFDIPELIKKVRSMVVLDLKYRGVEQIRNIKLIFELDKINFKVSYLNGKESEETIDRYNIGNYSFNFKKTIKKKKLIAGKEYIVE